MIDPEGLRRALSEKSVELSDQEIASLIKIVTLTERMYARRVGHESLDDFLGEHGRARIDAAESEARKALRDVVQRVGEIVAPPALVGDVDPLASVAHALLVVPSGARSTYAIDVAQAARNASARLREALAAIPQQDLALLRKAQWLPVAPGRPTEGLTLTRKIIVAVYYDSERHARDLTVSLGNPARGAQASTFVRLTQATLSALKLDSRAETIRSVINTYRRESLRYETEMKGDFETRRARLADFLR